MYELYIHLHINIYSIVWCFNLKKRNNNLLKKKFFFINYLTFQVTTWAHDPSIENTVLGDAQLWQMVSSYLTCLTVNYFHSGLVAVAGTFEGRSCICGGGCQGSWRAGGGGSGLLSFQLSVTAESTGEQWRHFTTSALWHSGNQKKVCNPYFVNFLL